MREALKRLTSESVVYGLGQVGGRAVQVLLVPVLTRAMLPGAYGIWELVSAYLQTGALLLVFGMDAALARFFYREPDRRARITMVSTSFAFRLATALAAAGVLALAARPLARELLGSDVYRKYFLIGAVTLPATLIVMFTQDVLRVTFQPWKFAALSVTQTLLVLVVSLALVLGRKLGVAGPLYGRLAGDGSCALLGIVLIRHSLRPRVSRDTLARMLRFGLPLVPVALAYGVITAMDRFALQRTRGLEEVATYAVAMKWFSVVSMGVSAFQLAYGPFAFARAETPEAPRLFARVLSLFMAVASLGAMAVGLFAPEVVAIVVPSAYRGAAGPAAWLAFAAVAQGAYTIASVGIGLSLRTSLLAWPAGAAALASLAGNLVLTPRLGPPGAAIATTLGYVTSAVLTHQVAQRVHPFPYRSARAAAVWIGMLAATIAAQRIAPAGAVGIGLKLVVMAIAAAVLWRLEAPRRATPAPAV